MRGRRGCAFGEGGVSLLAHFLDRGAAFGVQREGRGGDLVRGVEGEEGAVGLVQGVEFGCYGRGVYRGAGEGFGGGVEVEGKEGEGFVHCGCCGMVARRGGED